MRLLLRDVSPDAPDPADPPPLEVGRLTIGATAETARVDREGNAFLLTDTSRNGARVDGVDLNEGQRVTLRDGSHIVLGARQYRAEIVGDEVRGDYGPETSAMPTISSILADISPRGESARGPIPGRVHEEGIGEPPPQRWRDRDVTIGYGGPPETTREILPLDWNSEFSSDTEHAPATQTRVSVRTVAPAAPTSPPEPVSTTQGPSAEAALAAFLAAANVPAGAVAGDPLVVLRRAATMLNAALKHVQASERAVRDLYEAFDADPPVAATAELAELLASDAGAAALPTRLEALRLDTERWQRAAAEVIERGRELSPQVVRAKVDAQGTRRFGAEAAYWRAIVAAHEGSAPRQKMIEALGRGPEDRP